MYDVVILVAVTVVATTKALV